MNHAENNNTNDLLIRGLICDGQARFLAISARDLVQTAHVCHSTSATCSAALGRALMGACILGAMEKGFNEEVSVIIKGGGPSGSIVCVGRSDASVKGYIENPSIELPPNEKGKLDVGGVVGKDGTITVVRDLGLKEPYIGRADLVSGEIAEDFGAYFAFSQQQPAMVYLGVHISREFKISAASGVIIQPLPSCSQETLDLIENSSGSISQLTNTIKGGANLFDACNHTMSQLKPDVLDQMHPKFNCDCSRSRLEKVILALGADEIKDMIENDKGAELTCRFCQKQYHFNEEELVTILRHAL